MRIEVELTGYELDDYRATGFVSHNTPLPDGTNLYIGSMMENGSTYAYRWELYDEAGDRLLRIGECRDEALGEWEAEDEYGNPVTIVLSEGR